MISIVSYDGAGNRSYTEMTIEVVDKVKPSIQVDFSKFNKVQLNKEFTLPSVTAMDNYTKQENLECYVIIINQWDSEIYLLGDTVVFDEAGEYIIRYVVRDEAWNMTLTEVTIIVK